MNNKAAVFSKLSKVCKVIMARNVSKKGEIVRDVFLELSKSNNLDSKEYYIFVLAVRSAFTDFQSYIKSSASLGTPNGKHIVARLNEHYAPFIAHTSPTNLHAEWAGFHQSVTKFYYDYFVFIAGYSYNDDEYIFLSESDQKDACDLTNQMREVVEVSDFSIESKKYILGLIDNIESCIKMANTFGADYLWNMTNSYQAEIVKYISLDKKVSEPEYFKIFVLMTKFSFYTSSMLSRAAGFVKDYSVVHEGVLKLANFIKD